MDIKQFDLLRKSQYINKLISILICFSLLIVPLFSINISRVNAADLLQANFDSGTDGFSYQDDTFGTSQPNYASGSRVTGSNCYGGSGGCLNVRLGGVNNTAINNMSGGWKYTFSLANAESGVSLSLRYRLVMPAVYDYDEYSRVQVSVDGVMYGRGSKSYVDHVGGDNTFAHDAGWLQVELYIGDLASGSHNLIIGGYSNKKNASDEITDIYVDTVALTSGNPAPSISVAQVLVGRLDLTTFKSYIENVSSFGDRCRMSSSNGTNCVAPFSSYFNAQNWVASQLAAMGYEVKYNTYTTSLPGTTGSNMYVTKVGTTHPESMYIVSNMFDGRGGGGAADDDASGVALTMEIARILASPDVETDYSVRFLFFDEEESGLKGSQAYVSTRQGLRGIESPVGSGQYPEPNWLGIIQHDMILYDHGVGTAGANQSPYADLDVEWTAGATFANQSKELAQTWRFLNGTYATDYPANSADKSQSTDDYSFRNHCPAVSVRENRRGVSGEWINPYYHKATDIYSNYSEADFLLGFNAVQTTLGVVAELAGARVVSPHQAPVAFNQSVTTNEDTSVGITLTGMDPEGAALSYVVVTQPVNGSLSGTAPYLMYTPAADYNGADSFTFKVNDGSLDSAPATVSITINPINDPPTASPQSVSTIIDTPVAVTLSGSDPDADVLTFLIVSAPSNGTLEGASPVLTYTPASGFVGSDSFTFAASDGQLQSAPELVSITVNNINHPPVANPQVVATDEDTSLAITLTGSDPDNDPLVFSVQSNPVNGSLSGSGANWVYSPNANFFGQDSFNFIVNDGEADSAPASVLITVNPVNDPPVAISQSLTTNKNAALNIILSGTDVDNQTLTYLVVTQPTHGTLSGSAPNLTYTPQTDYVGPDSFAFVANDGSVNSQAASVSISVIQTGPVTIFFDNFETNLGWIRNPYGTDTAKLGLWERAKPQSTNYSGPKQLGTTVSGSYDLVTGPLAGSSYTSYDVDGGVTSIRSPFITLPATGNLEITFKYYMAHRNNSSSADYFRVKIVGSTTVTIYQELGAANDDDAVWATFTGSLNNFRGQSIYILIEAADMGAESLVEAAVDDVLIVQK